MNFNNNNNKNNKNHNHNNNDFGINPLGFVVRYNPPTIALIYTPSADPSKKRRYEIFLNALITLPTAADIAKQLILEHSHFLNEKIVSFSQVQRLVDKILANIEIVYEDEEGEVQQDNEYFANDLNKGFEIENELVEENNQNEPNLENFQGKGRIGFLKNLRKK